ncbi:MAG: DedA family protein [Methanosarcinales archaeon]|nr:DedA family protein [Methanosarcinales archaeon]
MLETITLYFSLFFTSFLASTIFPLGSEGLVVYLITQGHNIGIVVVIASIGNYLGACTTYLLGWVGREKYLEKYLRMKQSELERGEQIFEKYGAPILLFTWVPLVGDAIAAIGGIFKLNFVIFSVYVFIGKFIRYLAVAYLAGFI